jgi:hypothetical protein
MFVGHGLVAFSIAASIASSRGWTVERALAVGLLAGLFAMLPDVDMLYAVVGIIVSLEGGFVTSEAFWTVTNEVHRGPTHSLIVGAIAAIGFAGWRARADFLSGAIGVVALFGLVALGVAVSGPIPGAIVAAFALAGIGIVALGERFGLGAPAVFGAAALGLLTHPLEDVLAGPSPAFLYPFEISLLREQVSLHPDPTLHLLGALLIELATIWAALVVFARLYGWRLRHHANPRAALGLGYVGAVFVIPAPTVEVASPFVFSVLAVGLVGVPIRARWRREDSIERIVDTVTTALSAVTLAALAYGAAYLVVVA